MEKKVGGLRIASQSVFSYSMFALSVSTLAFTSLQGGTNFFGIIVALTLGLTGLVSSERFRVEQFEQDSPNTETYLNRSAMVGLFASLALVFFMIFDYLIPRIAFTQSTVSYTAFWGQFTVPINAPASTIGGLSVPTWFPAFDYIAVLIPNMEEQFFRGFWGNLAIRYVGPYFQGFAYIVGGFLGAGTAIFLSAILAAIPGGVLFGTFHTPAYNGSLPIILTLAADGTLIIALNSIVGRMDVSIMAHMANNALSFAFQQSSVLNLIPGLPPTPIHFIAPLVLPGVLLTVAVCKKRGVRCR